MKLFLLTQTENRGYDTYDSAIVAASTPSHARNIHPSTYSDWKSDYGSWASKPENVTATYIGQAKIGTKMGVILASFNAG